MGGGEIGSHKKVKGISKNARGGKAGVRGGHGRGEGGDVFRVNKK